MRMAQFVVFLLDLQNVIQFLDFENFPHFEYLLGGLLVDLIQLVLHLVDQNQ